MCLSKPCKKPKWREFEDSDDEKEYKQKLIKYRQWKYSLLSAKNILFEVTSSPSKNFLFKPELFVENTIQPRLLKKQSSKLQGEDKHQNETDNRRQNSEMDDKQREIECDDFAEPFNQRQEVLEEGRLYNSVVRSNLEQKMPALVLKQSNENLLTEQCLIAENGLSE